MDDVHLIIIGTFGVSVTGIASFEEVALMTITEQWLPIEHTFDKVLIETMVYENRSFMTGMRYNLLSMRPLACVIALNELVKEGQIGFLDMARRGGRHATASALKSAKPYVKLPYNRSLCIILDNRNSILWSIEETR